MNKHKQWSSEEVEKLSKEVEKRLQVNAQGADKSSRLNVGAKASFSYAKNSTPSPLRLKKM